MTPSVSRRDFSKLSIGAAATLAATQIPAVHAAGSDMIQLALVGCGGRGTGAANNALSTTSGPVKLVAMADVFEQRLATSHKSLEAQFNDNVDVPNDRRFIGFEAYKQAMDCLRPGDVALFTTPPAFRWVHFTYAIKKGLNVFMEKPVTVDGPTTKRMLALGEESERKNLKVGVGLMCRHCEARKELLARIKDGQIGDILLMRAYRMGGGGGTAEPRPDNLPETLYQIRRFHAFLWASGGLFSDYNIHNIDECCMMKDAWPVKAHAVGGRHGRKESYDQNFDNYSVEYTFEDGTKLIFTGRAMQRTYNEFASYAHGTTGLGVISTNSHIPARCRIYKGQNIKREAMQWAFPAPEPNPYQLEWDHLIKAIRNNTPHNEVQRGAIASLVTSMGRMAAHTGQVITYEQALNHDHEFCPNADQLTVDSTAPLQMDPKTNRYPMPEPGKKGLREY
jgi:predicted dehydrogenase